MKKIVICGCSFSSPVRDKYTGTHWAEIVANYPFTVAKLEWMKIK